MTLKCLTAGDLLAYFMSKRDFKGRLREKLAVWLGQNEPGLVKDLLRVMAPPHVKSKRKRRWIAHCRKHLTHLISGFSESDMQVAPFLGCVTRATELLVLAGLPPDALEFAWCEHPQSRDSHVHCALMRSLLPSGGWYQPRLSGSLIMDFSWLVSHRLGLSLPVNLSFARLVRGGTYSYQGENEKCIDLICEQTSTLFGGRSNGAKSAHECFLDMLQNRQKEFGIGNILVSPDESGLPVCRTDQIVGRLYRNGVAVEGPRSVIWLFGKVCRQSFEPKAWEQEKNQMKGDFQDKLQVYQRFSRQLEERCRFQQQQYPAGLSGLAPVTPEQFAWLDPAGRLEAKQGHELLAEDLFGLNMSLPRIESPWSEQERKEPVPEYFRRGPEIVYPYYSDLEYAERPDITEAPALEKGVEEDELDELPINEWPGLNGPGNSQPGLSVENPPDGPKSLTSPPSPTNPVLDSGLVEVLSPKETQAEEGSDNQITPAQEGDNPGPEAEENPSGNSLVEPAQPLTITSEPNGGPPDPVQETETQATPAAIVPEQPTLTADTTSGKPSASERDLKSKKLKRRRKQLQLEIALRVATEWDQQRRIVKPEPKPAEPSTKKSSTRTVSPVSPASNQSILRRLAAKAVETITSGFKNLKGSQSQSRAQVSKSTQPASVRPPAKVPPPAKVQKWAKPLLEFERRQQNEQEREVEEFKKRKLQEKQKKRKLEQEELKKQKGDQGDQGDQGSTPAPTPLPPFDLK